MTTKPPIVTHSPMQGTTMTIILHRVSRRGRWYKSRWYVGLIALWIALRLLGARVKVRWAKKEESRG